MRYFRIGLAWWTVVLVLLVASYARAQQCTPQQLHDEFFLDTTARTYVTCASDGNLAGPNVSDTCVLSKFNANCTDNAACKVDQTVTREQVWEVIDPGELTTLLRSTAANDLARVKALDSTFANVTFDMAKAPVRQKLLDIFPGPSAPITNAAITALQQKNVPRSQVVCHRVGTLDDVSCGLRGTACQ